MHIVLVTMPWAAVDAPSLSLSTLASIAQKSEKVQTVELVYGNLRWAEHVFAQQSFKPTDYAKVANGYFAATGEWVFSGALYGHGLAAETPFFSFAQSQDVDLTEITPLYDLAAPFIASLAQDIAAKRPDIVGFTTTFLQNVPSLALAKEVKRLLPDTRIIFGGANCDGVQGEALHTQFPFIDYVVRGEAEHTFPQLLDALAGEVGDLGNISGLCWRMPDGTRQVNPQSAPPVQMSDVPLPAFDAYFEELADKEIRSWISPRLWVEGSRGCWWGAKHHCTFCGLNGTSMLYRSKKPEQLWSELEYHVSRFRILDVMFADNILDMGYLNSFLPLIEKADIDLRIFFEIKSNLGFAQLAKLADARVVQVQPGIESLSSRVLSLMRKGVTGIQNVRLLRDCETLGISVAWNYLYGFPGEVSADYESVLRQFSALSHLQPPEGAIRVALERFSPYFNDPSLGLQSLGPAKFFTTVHDLPDEAIQALVYLYDSEPAGIVGEIEQQLRAGVRRWSRDREQSSLQLLQDGTNALVLEERRPGRPARLHHLAPGVETQAYLLLLPGRSRTTLYKEICEQGLAVSPSELDELLNHWVSEGLVFREGDNLVSLAVGAPDIAVQYLDRAYSNRARRSGTKDGMNEDQLRREPVLLPNPGRLSTPS
ncbi:RiPP maturation radical SAM C-methyltransferase [Streptomyces sp. NPDC059445]|uniref:RiPP maturation radical SAM C-methyltransferase n=1 Tax=Streptomyces sp. NPDC059445 TaxID=3346832 RepID=UPI00369A6D8B